MSDMNGDRPAVHTLTARSLESVFWLTLQNVLAATLLVAIPSVLAHFLTANDLGLLEIALAFFGLATLFMELGTGPAIIQRPGVDARFLATVFFVNMATGVIFATVLVVGAPSIAGWLRMDARLVPLLRVLGITLLPLSTAIVPRNLLAKRLLYRRVAMADAIAGATATLAAATGLSSGVDVALTRGFLVYGIVVTIVLWTSARWRPASAPDIGTVWPLLKFSVSVSASKTLENMSLQMDRFLLGRYLGAASLGLFGLARTVIRVPLRYLLNVSDEVLLPGLASLQEDSEQGRQYYLTALRVELAIVGPTVIFAGVFAAELSRLLFGPGWEGAVIVAQLLAFPGWRNVTGHTTGAVLLSHGRPDLQLRWTAYALALSIFYFFVGMPWGLTGVAFASATLETASWALRHTMANRVLGLTWKRFAAALAPLWIAHGTLVLVTMAIRQALLLVVAPPALRIAAALPLALAAYLVLVRLLVPGLLTTLRRGSVQSVTHGLTRSATNEI